MIMLISRIMIMIIDKEIIRIKTNKKKMCISLTSRAVATPPPSPPSLAPSAPVRIRRLSCTWQLFPAPHYIKRCNCSGCTVWDNQLNFTKMKFVSCIYPCTSVHLFSWLKNIIFCEQNYICIRSVYLHKCIFVCVSVLISFIFF